MKASNSAGPCGASSRPSVSSLALTSGIVEDLDHVGRQLARRSRRAPSPARPGRTRCRPRSRAAWPLRRRWATSGSALERLAVVTASGRSLPVLMWARASAAVSGIIVDPPASRSFRASGWPLYGTCVSFTPAICASSSPDRWLEVPMPARRVRQRRAGCSWRAPAARAMFLAGTLGVHDEHVGNDAEAFDGAEVSTGFQLTPLMQAGHHGVARAHAQQRVAVGRGLGDEFGADRAAGAGLVLDDHRLAVLGDELLADDARDRIDDAAGGEGHDDVDRLARIVVLRRCRGAREALRRPSVSAGHDPGQVECLHLCLLVMWNGDLAPAAAAMVRRAMLIRWIWLVPSYSRNRRTSR